MDENKTNTNKSFDHINDNAEATIQQKIASRTKIKNSKGIISKTADNQKSFRIVIIATIVILVISWGVSAFTQYTASKNDVNFSKLILDLREGKIEKIQECNGVWKSKYKNGEEKTTNVGAPVSSEIFSKNGLDINPSSVEFSVCAETIKPSEILGWVFNILFIGIIGYIAWRILSNLNDSGSKIFGFGETKAKFILGKKQETTLKDVAGVDEASEELNEIVMFLKSPEKFRKMGARIPKGILMVGAPGTGKTLLARAIAGEAGVPFFSTSGSEFEEMLVGAGASRVRDLFAKAKKVSPSLIFIDEVDAVGKRRGTVVNSSSTEQTLNQILVEMDGFEKNTNVIVIAATNRPDVLDPALLRPGRFDRKITLDLPDQDGRFAILKIHSKTKPLATDVDLEKIAKRTIGYSGADLENVLNEAAISAARHDKTEISNSDIEEATLKVVMGSARKRRRTEKELKTVAYHEAGHAVVSKLVPETDPVHKITIVSRGMSGGMTMQMPEEDEFLVSRTKMLSEIKTLLGGQVSERIFMGDITTGASNDIQRASKIARSMVKKYGMTSLGMIEYGQDDTVEGYGVIANYSEMSAQEIDKEVKQIITDCYKEVERIIQENKSKVELLKELLLAKEIVTSEEFNTLF
jgi:cell division protease FtsH